MLLSQACAGQTCRHIAHPATPQGHSARSCTNRSTSYVPIRHVDVKKNREEEEGDVVQLQHCDVGDSDNRPTPRS